MAGQIALFDSQPALPPGFRYEPDVVPRELEARLLDEIPRLPLKEFEFHGFVGKRRVAYFGWRYDFSRRRLTKADDIPPFLLEARDVAARFACSPATELQHVLVSEYGPGAAIGWHRDKREFGEVVGLSLLAPCQFRLRRRAGKSWERVTVTAEPRSAYLLSGAARHQWEHSIPPVNALRYSVTFRNLRADLEAAGPGEALDEGEGEVDQDGE